MRPTTITRRVITTRHRVAHSKGVPLYWMGWIACLFLLAIFILF